MIKKMRCWISLTWPIHIKNLKKKIKFNWELIFNNHEISLGELGTSIDHTRQKAN